LESARPDRLQPAALAAYGGGWSARLEASVARVAQRSTLLRVEHRGPMRLQKALWPEGADPVHLILLHPPGGIAGGDSLSLTVDVQPQAHALLTTPGAGRWYRGDAAARQDTTLRVAAGASLEWLPQETIVHDGVLADSTVDVSLDEGAAAIGWEVTVLGRRAFGERLRCGEFRQSLRISLRGEPLFEDHARICGEETGLPAALGERHVSGLLWAVSPRAFDADIAQPVEAAMTQAGATLAGASRVDARLLLARAVGSSPERVRAALAGAWEALRPVVLGRQPRSPRIWTT
jgi:urease accessory protein